MFDKEVSVQMAKRNTLGVADLLAERPNGDPIAYADRT